MPCVVVSGRPKSLDVSVSMLLEGEEAKLGSKKDSTDTNFNRNDDFPCCLPSDQL